MRDPQSGSLGLSVVAEPSPRCQSSTLVLPQGEPARDAPQFGFFQPRLPVAVPSLGELPALGLGGSALVMSACSCFSPKASTTWKGSLWTGWGITSTGRMTAPKRPSASLGWRRPPKRGRH